MIATEFRSTQIKQARHIKRTLGLRSAIGFLRARGWSPEATVWILLYQK